MIRSLYLNSHGARQEDLSGEAIAAALASSKGLLWVDISDASDEAKAALRDTFRFHPLAIEDCFNERVDTPKVDDYHDYLFIVSQSIRFDRALKALELAEVDIFLGPNYVVSSHVHPIAEVGELFEKARVNEHLLNRGADMLAQSIIDALVDHILPSVEAIDEELEQMEEGVIDNPNRRVLPKLLLLRRHTMRLRRSILPQRDVVNRLSRGEFPRLIRDGTLIFYRDVYDHTVRIEEILESIRDVADSVLGTYLSAVNNRMNEVMKTLSVVTAIFLPLTLIASIFGTNLDYSSLGLELTHGFLWMLASMVVIGVAMVGFFRYRGWF